MKRPRLAGFLYGYALCALLMAGMLMSEQLGEMRDAIAEGEPAQPVKRLVQALAASLALALCSVPIRILLGLFPEASPRSAAGMLRRILIGALCGPLPVLAVMLLGRQSGPGGEVLGIGLLLGALVGLGDSVALDHAARDQAARRGDEDDAE